MELLLSSEFKVSIILKYTTFANALSSQKQLHDQLMVCLMAPNITAYLKNVNDHIKVCLI